MPPKIRSKNNSFQYAPVTIEEGWLHLAASVLLLAISDARENRDPFKRAQAKAWLLSPAAEFIFDEVMNIEFDLRIWVLADCPKMEKE